MDYGELFVEMVKYGSGKDGGQTYAMLDLEGASTKMITRHMGVVPVCVSSVPSAFLATVSTLQFLHLCWR